MMSVKLTNSTNHLLVNATQQRAAYVHMLSTLTLLQKADKKLLMEGVVSTPISSSPFPVCSRAIQLLLQRDPAGSCFVLSNYLYNISFQLHNRALTCRKAGTLWWTSPDLQHLLDLLLETVTSSPPLEFSESSLARVELLLICCLLLGPDAISMRSAGMISELKLWSYLRRRGRLLHDSIQNQFPERRRLFTLKTMLFSSR